MEIFAERLRELRMEKELSQRELAEATGLTQSAINLWENAQRIPNGVAIATLASVFGVAADYVLGLDD